MLDVLLFGLSPLHCCAAVASCAVLCCYTEYGFLSDFAKGFLVLRTLLDEYNK